MHSFSRLFLALAAAAGLLVSPASAAPAPDSDSPVPAPGLEKKTPGWIFNRPAKNNSSDQMKYAGDLLSKGKESSAMSEYSALVHEWHDSAEAPAAQAAYAKLLEKNGDLMDAFDEFQYLIKFYTGRFNYEEALEHQFDIASRIRTAKSMKFIFFSGFSTPERALPLLQNIIENGPGWKKTPEAQFTIGVIYEGLGKLTEAVQAYETVRTKYPGSIFSGEAAFRRVSCLYRQSDENRRDETLCRNALSALFTFISEYKDDTDNIKTAKAYIEELKDRLTEMYYQRAAYYDKVMKKTDAAIIAYKDFLEKAPRSDKYISIVNERLAALQAGKEKADAKKK